MKNKICILEIVFRLENNLLFSNVSVILPFSTVKKKKDAETRYLSIFQHR
jgi:hypothetical protein